MLSRTSIKALALALSVCLGNYLIVTLRYSLRKGHCPMTYSHLQKKVEVQRQGVRRENSTSSWTNESEIIRRIERRTNQPLEIGKILEAKKTKYTTSQFFPRFNAVPDILKSRHVLDVTPILQTMYLLLKGKSTLQLLGCAELESPRPLSQFPKITLFNRSHVICNGQLQFSNSSPTIPITIKKFDSKLRHLSYSGEAVGSNHLTIHSAIKEVVNLLKMKDLYGVPRLYGLCMKTADGDDLVHRLFSQRRTKLEKVDLEGAASFWYLTSRHENQMRICTTENRDCKWLTNLTRTLRGRKNRSESALTVMLNVAKLFQQFSERGIALSELNPSKFFIDLNLDIVCTDVTGMFFMRKDQGIGSARLLSNTVCKFAKDCPAIEWPVIYAPYAFSKYCIEISGLCGNNNQCWGLDSTTHACLLSRWMFIRLHGLISSFWPRLAEVAEIIKCSSRLYPEERCSWAYMRNKLEELRKFAQTEVKGL